MAPDPFSNILAEFSMAPAMPFTIPPKSFVLPSEEPKNVLTFSRNRLQIVEALRIFINSIILRSIRNYIVMTTDFSMTLPKMAANSLSPAASFVTDFMRFANSLPELANSLAPLAMSCPLKPAATPGDPGGTRLLLEVGRLLFWFALKRSEVEGLQNGFHKIRWKL